MHKTSVPTTMRFACFAVTLGFAVTTAEAVKLIGVFPKSLVRDSAAVMREARPGERIGSTVASPIPSSDPAFLHLEITGKRDPLVLVDPGLESARILSPPAFERIVVHTVPPQAKTVKLLLAQTAAASAGLYEIMHVTRVDDPANSSLYYVQSNRFPGRFIDTTQELIAETNRVGAGTRAESVYLFVDGPAPEIDARALQISLANVRHDVGTPVLVAREPLSAIAGSATAGLSAYAFAAPLDGWVSLRRDGGYTYADGAFAQTVRTTTRNGTLTITVIARTKAMIERFLHALVALLSNPKDYQSKSYLAVVQEARMAMARDLNMTLAEVDREFGVNTGNSQIALDNGADVPQLAAIQVACVARR